MRQRTGHRPSSRTAVLVCTAPANLSDISPDKDGNDWRELVLVPDGDTPMADGSTLSLDADSAADVIAEANRRGIDIVIDLNHETYLRALKGEGGSAPAVGWVKYKSIKYQPGKGLVGSVEWNDDGAHEVHGRRHRYASPTVVLNKKTQRPKRLHSVAITNTPLTLNARELKAASDFFLGAQTMPEPLPDDAVATGPSMDYIIGQIVDAMDLDVSADADITSVLQAILANVKGGSSETEEETAAASELRATFGLGQAETICNVAAKAKNLKDEHGILTEKVKTMSETLEKLQGEKLATGVSAAITADIAAGKINPKDESQVKSCTDFANRDLKAYSEFMATQPRVIPANGVIPAGKTGNTPVGREAIIVAARKEFKDEGGEASCFSEREYVNQELREANLDVLADDETKTLAIAGV
jgi:hypothetical protein